MPPLSDPRRIGHSAPYQHDNSAATLFALLLVVAVPALVVALAAGWRPLSGSDIGGPGQWLAALTGRAAPAASAGPAARAWAVPGGWF